MSWWSRFIGWFKAQPDDVLVPEGTVDEDSSHSEQVSAVIRDTLADSPRQSLAMPYDESLLDRVRLQWQLGEFEQTAALSHGEIAAHPARGLLAAYVGAAHEQTGERDAARQWYQRARDWGCPQRKLAEIMLGNLHSTFAQVKALLGDEASARDQLLQMAAISSPGTESERLLNIRMDAMKAQRLLAVAGPETSRVFNAHASVAGATDSSAGQTLAPAKLQEELSQWMTESMNRISDQVKKSVNELRADVSNATRQLEAHAELQAYLRDEQTMPALHGWPVSPDIAALLLRLIEQRNFSAVIEFGSGSSTFLMGTALLRARAGSNAVAPLLSCDHLSTYCQATRDLIAKLQPSDHVQVEYAPLVPRKGSDGLDYLYYDCDSALQSLARRIALSKADGPLLVFVDGPPGLTGLHARFPALDAVLEAFPEHAIVLVLDDYVRAEEKVVGEKWKKRLGQLDRIWNAKTVKLEKDALIIEIEGISNVTA